MSFGIFTLLYCTCFKNDCRDSILSFPKRKNVVSLKVSLIIGGDFHMKWIQMPLAHYKQMLIF